MRAGDFVFHDQYFGKVSVEAKTVISNLLTVTVDKRWTAKDALASDWFKKRTERDLSSRDLSGTIAEIKSFNARRKWHVAKTVIKWAANQPFWKPDAVTFSQQLSEWDKQVLKEAKGTESSQGGDKPIGSVPSIKFADAYELGSKLRAGSYATVWQCIHIQSKEVFAVKIIERKGLKPSDDEAVLNEAAIMRKFLEERRGLLCTAVDDHSHLIDCFVFVLSRKSKRQQVCRSTIRLLRRRGSVLSSYGACFRWRCL